MSVRVRIRAAVQALRPVDPEFAAALARRWAELPVILIGFSPPAPLAAIARHLGWPGAVLTDPHRVLYRRLGIARAPVWRVYSPGTLATYAVALGRGHRLARAVEDTRQLGADAIMVRGVVRRLWRPRSPDDRPEAAEVVAAARLAARA